MFKWKTKSGYRIRIRNTEIQQRNILLDYWRYNKRIIPYTKYTEALLKNWHIVLLYTNTIMIQYQHNIKIWWRPVWTRIRDTLNPVGWGEKRFTLTWHFNLKKIKNGTGGNACEADDTLDDTFSRTWCFIYCWRFVGYQCKITYYCGSHSTSSPQLLRILDITKLFIQSMWSSSQS